MPDGVRLAARIWLPQPAVPRPAILEIIPYRKRDMVRARDERNHPVFAAAGYACLRVDMRGSGDSEGVMPDMYAPDELADTRHVIDWIAAQPWCNGRVGMFGTSWGGTASLQAAVDAPGPLKAVIANCATWDRFEDDIHWMGGCLLTDSVEWGATLPAILAAPPDSATTGEPWRDIWRYRLANLPFPLNTWVAEHRRGAYWRRGSVRFQAERINRPILAIGGWSDRYSNSVTPLVAARPDLCWGVVGPWGHHYPGFGEPGPSLAFQAMALAWWDHWLRADDPGPPDWPRLRLWRREFDPPKDRLSIRAGGWFETDTPEPTETSTLHLTADHGLVPHSAGGSADLAIPFDPLHGVQSGDTGYFGRTGGLPLDQAPDDARTLAFETGPLDEDLVLGGAATLALTVSRKRRQAQIAARLCDVAPDGRSNLITRTVLNLALDETLDNDRAFAAGEPQPVSLHFPTTAYRVRRGHRLRLALAGSYWPLVFPPREDPGLIMQTENAALTLPAFAAAQCDEGLDWPLPGPIAPSPAVEALEQPELERDAPTLEDGWWTMGWRQPRTSVALTEIDTVFRYETSAEYRISAAPPISARCRITHVMTIERPDGVAEIRSEAEVLSTGAGPKAKGRLTALFNGDIIASTSEG